MLSIRPWRPARDVPNFGRGFVSLGFRYDTINDMTWLYRSFSMTDIDQFGPLKLYLVTVNIANIGRSSIGTDTI